ncbi:MAG: putative signal transducing protein [Fluviicola sp.]|jgi:hypothetical protein
MEIIPIRAYNDVSEAYIVKNALEAEGISCYIRDEHTLTVNPLYNAALGGIKLCVQESDVESAHKILIGLESTPLTDDDGNTITCPKCGSDHIIGDYKSMRDPRSILAILIAFFFAIFPFFVKSVRKCKDCGAEFK